VTLTVSGRQLRKVAVVDDDQIVRETYAESLSDLGLEPVPFDGPLGDLDEVVRSLSSQCDSIVTDLVLKRSGYAKFDGGALAAACRRQGIPTIVCTSYADVLRQVYRNELRWIPSILPKAEFAHEPIVAGFERVIQEIGGKYDVERRGWRTQVQVKDVAEDGYFYVIVMGRSADEKVPLHRDAVPADIQAQIAPGRILHALVNTAASRSDELFFDEWEPQ